VAAWRVCLCDGFVATYKHACARTWLAPTRRTAAAAAAAALRVRVGDGALGAWVHVEWTNTHSYAPPTPEQGSPAPHPALSQYLLLNPQPHNIL
jgi:hypothetical protein